MADFSTLASSTNYLTLLQQISDRDRDVAMALDPATTSPTNVPTGAVRFSSANKRWEKWSGSAWGELIAAATDAFTMTVTGLRGGTLYGNTSNGGTISGGTIDVTTLKQGGSVAWTAATLTNLNQLTNGPGYLTSASLSGYAPLASPTFTGTPTAPTAAVNTATTQLATTAYVVNQGYLKTATAATTYAPLGGAGVSGTWAISVTGAAGSAPKLTIGDTRATNPSPGGRGMGVWGDFKQNTSDGLADGGTYHGVLTVQQYADDTGGGVRQLGFTDNDHLWIRGSGGDWTSWGAWKQVLDSGNFNGYAPTLTGTGASGTWGINVTGSAGSVAWTNVSGRPSNVSSFSNDAGYYASGASATLSALSVTTGSGRVALTAGGSSTTGYIQFIHASGNRQGYIGFSSTNSSTDTGTVNYVAGTHAFTGAVNASSFSGPLTGNVTGNVTGSSGSCTGNAATASSVAWAGVTGKPVTTFTTTSGMPTGGSPGDEVWVY